MSLNMNHNIPECINFNNTLIQCFDGETTSMQHNSPQCQFKFSGCPLYA